jgi:hypothetical protein
MNKRTCSWTDHEHVQVSDGIWTELEQVEFEQVRGKVHEQIEFQQVVWMCLVSINCFYELFMNYPKYSWTVYEHVQNKIKNWLETTDKNFK